MKEFQSILINKKTDKFGNVSYYNEKSQYHREDGPAVEYVNGDKYWYQNGKRHRIDGPAVERINGDKFWYQNGKIHREDGPAVEWYDGVKSWYWNGIELGSSLYYYNQKKFEQWKKFRAFK